MSQPAPAADISTASNETGFDLIRRLDPDGTKNCFISPYSISTALTVTANGARSSTLAAMRQALHLKEISIEDADKQYKNVADVLTKPRWNGPNDVTLTVANGLFVQKKYVLLKPFLDVAMKQFGAEVDSVDFKAGGTEGVINGWVAKKTNNKIKSIVSRLDTTTRLVITNAVYFKGTWQHQFEPTFTQPGPFHATASNTIQVPMMSQQDHFVYSKGDGFEVLRMPYQNSDLGMVIVLPAKNSSVAAILKQMTTPFWQKLVGAGQQQQVEVTMPKFKIEYSASLAKPLKEMGMAPAFTMAADFSGISASKEEPLFIDDVLHKTFVDVNETGTEAAAATAVVMATGAMMPAKPIPFVVDRPFLVAIHHQPTNTVLFFGAINDPRK